MLRNAAIAMLAEHVLPETVRDGVHFSLDSISRDQIRRDPLVADVAARRFTEFSHITGTVLDTERREVLVDFTLDRRMICS